jgi:hypothetical protein
MMKVKEKQMFKNFNFDITVGVLLQMKTRQQDSYKFYSTKTLTNSHKKRKRVEGGNVGWNFSAWSARQCPQIRLWEEAPGAPQIPGIGIMLNTQCLWKNLYDIGYKRNNEQAWMGLQPPLHRLPQLRPPPS